MCSECGFAQDPAGSCAAAPGWGRGTEAQLRGFLVDARIRAEIELHDEVRIEHLVGQARGSAISFLPMKMLGGHETHAADYLGNSLEDARFDGLDLVFCLAREDIALLADQDTELREGD